MRMRAKKNRTARLERVQSLMTQAIDPTSLQNREVFLEIGCGKGAFAVGMSQKHPQTAYIAVEKVIDVMLMAMEKAAENNCQNIVFMCSDAEKIDEIIPPCSVDRLFLNFSDPWHRSRHEKRRLTSPQFLQRYKKILKPNAVICQKTDNLQLFEFSLESLAANGFDIIYQTYDLHNDPKNQTNIRTEYENNFTQKGFKINYLEALNRNQ